jgi:hypothetical protein
VNADQTRARGSRNSSRRIASMPLTSGSDIHDDNVRLTLAEDLIGLACRGGLADDPDATCSPSSRL